MGLTNEQMQQQEAAAFGLPLRPQTLDVSNMTHEQVEALRGVLFQYDARNAAMQREFDLNKPPTPPYRYQEYPRMLYLGRETAIVKDEFELEQYLAHGWSKEPQEAPMLNLGGDLPPSMMAEVAAIDAEARKPSREDLERQIAVLRAENDALKAPSSSFFKERCRFDSEAKCAWKILWAAYRSWVTAEGERHTLDTHQFALRLLELGCTRTRFTGGTRAWQGIALLEGLE
jgi:hypothetical protein